jgi:adenosylcobinamide-GDP ribazoletransferase
LVALALWRFAGASLTAAAAAAGVALAGAAAAGLWFRRRAGGVTGDFLGATEQIGEVLVLLALAALHSSNV